MDDLISRQAALDCIVFMKSRYDRAGGEFWIPTGEALKALTMLPSAQQWISCSERLPDDEQLVLFSTRTGRVHQGRYHKDDSVNQWYSSIDKMRAYNNVVNAWMPLPPVYKEEIGNV